MLSCHVRPKRATSFVVGEENPKPVPAIELDRKPGSSRSRTLAMQPDCFPQQKEVTSCKWTARLSQCHPQPPPIFTRTQHTHAMALLLSVLVADAVLTSHFIRKAYSWKWGGGGSTGGVNSKSQRVPVARMKLCTLTSFIFFPVFGLPPSDFSRLPCKNKLSALEFVWC